jgi:hypothetical protein
MYLKINPIVAEEAAEKLGFSSKTGEKRSSVAKAIVDLIGFARGLKPPSPSALSFSAACKAYALLSAICGPTKVVPLLQNVKSRAQIEYFRSL